MRELGFDTRFMRIWEFYLAYCEAAFDTGNTDVMQFTLRRRLSDDATTGPTPCLLLALALPLAAASMVAPRAVLARARHRPRC